VYEFKQSAIVTSDGAELAIYTAGRGPQTALLLHGFTLDHTCWNPVATHLVDRGMSVVALDVRGHGRSTLGSSPPDIKRLTLDVFEAISQRQLTDVVLIGHSLGAYIALAARTDPSLVPLVKRVIIISGMATSIQNPFVKAGARVFSSGVGRRLVQQDRIGRLMLQSWFRPSATDAEIEAVRVISVSCPTRTCREIARATTRIDLKPSLPFTGPPTLVICGAQDRATPSKFSQEIADSIGGASLTLIEDAGHMVITEQSAATAAAITDWLSAPSAPLR
jgi:pimeloyl-ACP methyl ester carboxylesterase